jgi:hypothetical protein
MERNKMSCCGQKRQAWHESNTPKVQAVVPSPPVLQNAVSLHHLGASSLVINGAVTGYTYLFAGHDTSLSVDERDVPALLSCGHFTIKPE